MKRRVMDAMHKVQVDMGLKPSAAASVADYATTYGGTAYMSPPQSVLSTSTGAWFTTGTVVPSTYAAASSAHPTLEPSVYAGVHASNRLQ